MFFDAHDKIHQAMRRVVEKLEQAGIAYAIAGGMAVNAHRHVRTTQDVDFLVTSNGLASFMHAFVPVEFEPVACHPRRFRDRVTGVTFDVLVSGLFPGSGQPGPIAYPEPADVSETIDGVRVLTLAALIGLKLAAARYKDFGDVVELIRIHDLDESFASQLPPSVARDFIECLEEKRREDEYETRQDRAFEQQRDAGKPSGSA